MIESLPYWDKDTDFPCMYSGTFKTSDTDDHNLFYWFFRNTESKDDLPLVLWINGGPGSSSMFGLFLENGPLRISKTGPSDDDYKLGMNEEGSWVDIANIIFLD